MSAHGMRLPGARGAALARVQRRRPGHRGADAGVYPRRIAPCDRLSLPACACNRLHATRGRSEWSSCGARIAILPAPPGGHHLGHVAAIEGSPECWAVDAPTGPSGLPVFAWSDDLLGAMRTASMPSGRICRCVAGPSQCGTSRATRPSLVAATTVEVPCVARARISESSSIARRGAAALVTSYRNIVLPLA
jgi:hypothetical protein